MDAYAVDGYDKNQPVVVRFLYLLNRIATCGVQHPRELRLAEQLAQVPFVHERTNVSEFALSQFFPELLTEAQNQHLLKDLPPSVMWLLIRGVLNALIEANATGRLDKAMLEQAVSACWDAIKR